MINKVMFQASKYQNLQFIIAVIKNQLLYFMSSSKKKCNGSTRENVICIENPIQIQHSLQQKVQDKGQHSVKKEQIVVKAEDRYLYVTPTKKSSNQVENLEVKDEGTAGCWNKLSKKQKIAVVTTHILLIIIAVVVTMVAVQFFHLKDRYVKTKVETFSLNNQSIVIQSFNYSHFVLVGQNENSQGQVISLPSPTQAQGSPAPGIIVVYDRQMGITLKMIGERNYIVEIDPNELSLYYAKHHPVQTKRLLAYLSLKRHLQDKNSFTEAERQILKKVAEATQMDDVVIEQGQYYVANRTPSGLELQSSKVSSRMLQFGKERLLTYGDWIYLMNQNIPKLKRMSEAAKKASTVIIVYNIININNNVNVTINLNSSTNVIVNNNQNGKVNINQGKDSQVAVQVKNSVQVNNNNNPKRSLSIQKEQSQANLGEPAIEEVKLMVQCNIDQKTISCKHEKDLKSFQKDNLEISKTKRTIMTLQKGKQDYSKQNFQQKKSQNQAKPNRIAN